MLNPSSSSKSPLSSRVALPIALMLAGVFGLGIAMVQPVTVAKLTKPEPVSAPAGTATPDLAAAGTNAKNDAPSPPSPDLVAFCSRNVTEKRSFVVFKRGTCVVITEPCENPMGEAKKILARCKDIGARFQTEATTEGDVIVAFKDPVFHRFSQMDLAKMQSWLQQPATALLTPEESVLAGESWVPPQQAKIGLLARRRMLEDAANAVPVKVIRAKERALAAR